MCLLGYGIYFVKILDSRSRLGGELERDSRFWLMYQTIYAFQLNNFEPFPKSIIKNPLSSSPPLHISRVACNQRPLFLHCFAPPDRQGGQSPGERFGSISSATI